MVALRFARALPLATGVVSRSKRLPVCGLASKPELEAQGRNLLHPLRAPITRWNVFDAASTQTLR